MSLWSLRLSQSCALRRSVIPIGACAVLPEGFDLGCWLLVQCMELKVLGVLIYLAEWLWKVLGLSEAV